MSNIKNYTTLFATKLNYVLDQLNNIPSIHRGRSQAIANMFNETVSNINNWLYAGRLPKDTKIKNRKLEIADILGVSHNYLFNDKISCKNITKPEIYKSVECYLVPFIEESQIFEFKNKKIFPIKNRFPVMFNNFDQWVKKYGTNIYVTRTNSEPYVKHDHDIVYVETPMLDDLNLVIHEDKTQNQYIAKKLVKLKSKLYLESQGEGDELKQELLTPSDNFLSIIFQYPNRIS